MYQEFFINIKSITGIINWSGKVAIADNQERRIHGLLDIKKLKNNHGMLFLLDNTEYQNITTVNMKFSIDVICFNAESIVNNILLNISPGKILSLQVPLRYFLEINSGEGTKISIGDKFILT